MIAIYARQSLDKKDSLSIESQIDKCIALCQYNEWEYSVYNDKGYSGKNLDRPQFKKMMEEIKNGKIQKIICYRLDRISRSMADFSNLIVELESYGCQFISATENFDTSTPLGRAMVNIIMTFAQLERETVVERVTDNYYFRTALGHWGGGPAPYGYKLKRVNGGGKKYTILDINHDEAEVIRKIYDWYLEIDGSVTTIIEKLNLYGYKSRGNNNGKRVWTQRVISDYLCRALYTQNDMKIYDYFKKNGANFVNDISDFDGTKSINVYGKTSKNLSKHKRCRKLEDQYLCVMEHEPIIDSETWIKVQHKLGRIRQAPSRSGTSGKSPFSGLLRCGYCGYSISTSGSRNNTTYYVCSSKKNRGKDSCNSKTTRQDILDDIVITKLINHINSKEFIDIISNSKSDYLIPRGCINKKKELESDLIKIDSEIDNLISSIASGNSILIKYLEERITQLDEKKKELNKELNNLESNFIEDNEALLNIKKELRANVNIEYDLRNGDINTKKRLSKIFISQITIFCDEVIVEYRI